MAANHEKDTAKQGDINTMAYSNCRTRIIPLSELNLPTSRTTTEDQFHRIYTEYMNNPANEPTSHHLQSAVTSLKTGIAPPVAFPTETVYGLGADATNPASIAGIYAAKGRPSDNPLIVHVSSINHLERLYNGRSHNESTTAIPEVYRDLVAHFWPGPLTILLPVPVHNSPFAPNVHPGQKTIGFRVPQSPAARFLIAVTERPIAAPSANSSGKPSPTTAKHVLDDLNGKINFILDGGACEVGVESTVVDALEGGKPVVLRPGGISRRMLREFGQSQPEGSAGRIWAEVENAWDMRKQGRRSSMASRNSSNQMTGPGQDRLSKLGNTAAATSNHDLHISDDHDEKSAPRAPGMKYKHYSPTAPLYLIEQTKPRTLDLPTSNLSRQAILQVVYTHIAAQRHQPTKLTLGVLPSTEWTAFGGLIDNGNTGSDADAGTGDDVRANTNGNIDVTVQDRADGKDFSPDDARIEAGNTPQTITITIPLPDFNKSIKPGLHPSMNTNKIFGSNTAASPNIHAHRASTSNLSSSSSSSTSTNESSNIHNRSALDFNTGSNPASSSETHDHYNHIGSETNTDTSTHNHSHENDHTKHSRTTTHETNDFAATASNHHKTPLDSNTPSTTLKLQIYSLPLGSTASTIAASLFSTLRHCDSIHCDLIVAEAPRSARIPAQQNGESQNHGDEEEKEEEEFETVLERMRKAAGGRVVEC